MNDCESKVPMIKCSTRKNLTLNNKSKKRKTLHLLIGVTSVIIVIITTIFIVYSTNNKNPMDVDSKVATANALYINPCTDAIVKYEDLNGVNDEKKTIIGNKVISYIYSTDKITNNMDNETDKTTINYIDIDNDLTTNSHINMHTDVYTNPPPRYTDTEEIADIVTVKYINSNTTDKVTTKHTNINIDKDNYYDDTDDKDTLVTYITNTYRNTITNKHTNNDVTDKNINTEAIDKSTVAVTDKDTINYNIDINHKTTDKYVDTEYIHTRKYTDSNKLINTVDIKIENDIDTTTKTTTTYRNKYAIDKSTELAIDKDKNWSQTNKYNLNIFVMEHLQAHNFYRKLHGCPPLRISRAISEFSQQWAKKIAADGTMSHSKGSEFGENIYWSRGMKINGSIPVDRWYNEYNFYNFGIDEFSFKTGHLTQLLWKSTELIGIGVVFKNWNEIYVVTNYYPKGNIPGQFYKMVPKPL